MPETGRTWQKPFKGLPREAWKVRRWTAARVDSPDAVLVAHELFVAVLGTRPDTVEMTLSTAGRRIRITATGPLPLALHHSHGPGSRIVAGLARITGRTPDARGVWAELPRISPQCATGDHSKCPGGLDFYLPGSPTDTLPVERLRCGCGCEHATVPDPIPAETFR